MGKIRDLPEVATLGLLDCAVVDTPAGARRISAANLAAAAQSKPVSILDRYAHLGRQVAYARTDRAMRIRDLSYADGETRSYPATARYALLGRQVVYARTDRALGVQDADLTGGRHFPEQPVARSTRLALMGQQVTYAEVDRALRVSTASLPDGTRYPRTASAVTTAAPPILILGDSLSEQTYAPALAAALDRTVYNLSVGGMTDRQQVIWAGMKAVPVTVAGNRLVEGANTIVQLGDYAISGMSGSGAHADNWQWLSTPADLATRTSRVQLGSTLGTVTRTAASATSEAYSFTPDPGQPLPPFLPPGTPLTVLPAVDYSKCSILYRSGRNSYFMPDVVKDSVNAVVAYAAHGRLLLASILNGTYPSERYDGAGPGAGWQVLFNLEHWLAARLPGRFVPRRRRLIDRALSGMGVAITSQDQYDQRTDTVPWSLHQIESRGTLAAAIGAADTAFTVTLNSGGLSVSTVMRIESEFVLITAIDGARVTNCVRGFGGSAAAAHAAGVATTTIDKIHLSTATYAYEAAQDAVLIQQKGY